MNYDDMLEIEIVHCSECDFRSPNLTLTRCPQDGTILGELTSTIEIELDILTELEQRSQS